MKVGQPDRWHAASGDLSSESVSSTMGRKDNTSPHSAQEYNEAIRKTIPYYDCFLSETVDLVKTVRPDVKVWLDTGCGTGTLMGKAIPLFPDTVFVLPDPSEGMLAKAKQSLKLVPPWQLRFLSPVATENLPFDAFEPPQVITAIQSHHYLDKDTRRIATQRCCDLLVPGGIYVTFENIHPLSQKGVGIGLERWKSYQVSQGRDRESVEEHGKRFNIAYFPISVDEHIRLLTECGFHICELFWYSHLQAGFYAMKYEHMQV